MTKRSSSDGPIIPEETLEQKTQLEDAGFFGKIPKEIANLIVLNMDIETVRSFSLTGKYIREIAAPILEKQQKFYRKVFSSLISNKDDVTRLLSEIKTQKSETIGESYPLFFLNLSGVRSANDDIDRRNLIKDLLKEIFATYPKITLINISGCFYRRGNIDVILDDIPFPRGLKVVSRESEAKLYNSLKIVKQLARNKNIVGINFALRRNVATLQFGDSFDGCELKYLKVTTNISNMADRDLNFVTGSGAVKIENLDLSDCFRSSDIKQEAKKTSAFMIPRNWVIKNIILSKEIIDLVIIGQNSDDAINFVKQFILNPQMHPFLETIKIFGIDKKIWQLGLADIDNSVDIRFSDDPSEIFIVVNKEALRKREIHLRMESSFKKFSTLIGSIQSEYDFTIIDPTKRNIDLKSAINQSRFFTFFFGSATTPKIPSNQDQNLEMLDKIISSFDNFEPLQKIRFIEATAKLITDDQDGIILNIKGDLQSESYSELLKFLEIQIDLSAKIDSRKPSPTDSTSRYMDRSCANNVRKAAITLPIPKHKSILLTKTN